MIRRVVHAAVALAGALAVVWALTLGADPVLTCREVVMAPGDVCPNAQGTRSQTYEERLLAVQQARPVVGVVGGLVALFGTALLAGERRRARDDAVRSQGSRLIGP